MTQATYAQFGSAPGPFVTRKIDEFTQGYLEAVAFTDMSDSDDECHDCELSEDALAEALDDCAQFQADNAELLSQAYERRGYGAVQAGHDLWLTRNHHGAGYWDRTELGVGQGHADAGGIGLADKLTDAAHAFGERGLYKGDDGKAYFA